MRLSVSLPPDASVSPQSPHSHHLVRNPVWMGPEQSNRSTEPATFQKRVFKTRGRFLGQLVPQITPLLSGLEGEGVTHRAHTCSERKSWNYVTSPPWDELAVRTTRGSPVGAQGLLGPAHLVLDTSHLCTRGHVWGGGYLCCTAPPGRPASRGGSEDTARFPRSL